MSLWDLFRKFGEPYILECFPLFDKGEKKRMFYKDCFEIGPFCRVLIQNSLGVNIK